MAPKTDSENAVENKEGNQTQAVQVTKPNQGALFNVNAFNNNSRVAAVFGVKEVKGKDLDKVEFVAGGNMVPLKRSEIAANLNLKGKGHREELDVAIREIGSEAMVIAKKHIAGLNQNWVLKQFRSKLVKDGDEMVEELSIRMRNLPPKTRALAIKYMMAMGWSQEEATKMVDAKNPPPISVETTVTATNKK